MLTMSSGRGLIPQREEAGVVVVCVFAIGSAPFLGLALTVPHRDLVRLTRSMLAGYHWIVKAIGLRVAHPLPSNQALRGAALLALAHPVVGGGGRHPIVAEVAASAIAVVFGGGGGLLTHGGALLVG